MSDTQDKPPIEQMVVFNQIISAEQLAQCRQLQQELQEQYGLAMSLERIIVERLYAVKRDLRAYLQSPHAAQELLRDAGMDVAVYKFTPPEHEKLMALVREQRLCTQEQIMECYDLQIALEKRGLVLDLGEILILKNYLPADIRQQVVDQKRQAIKADPRRFPYRLGQLALLNNFISEAQLQKGLEIQTALQQAGFYMPIGQILIEKQYISRAAVKALLKAQVHLDFLAPQDASIGVIKFSPQEHEAALKIIKNRNLVPLGLLEQAKRMSEFLQKYGITKGAVEILLERGIVDPEPLEALLKGTAELIRRLEGEVSQISLQLPVQEVPTKSAQLSDADFLFGRIAMYQGVISAAQLEHCIALLEYCYACGMRLSLGQLMLDMFYDDQERIRAFREVQREMKSLLGIDYPIKLVKFSSLEHKIVVDRIKEGRLVDKQEMLECYDIQIALEKAGCCKDLVEILIARNSIAPEVVADILKSQEQRIQRLVGGWQKNTQTAQQYSFDVTFEADSTPYDRSKTLLGYLAVEEGLLTSAQLSDALFVQLKLKQMGIIKRLGQICIYKDYLTEGQVKRLLEIQCQKLKGFHQQIKVDESQLTETDRILCQQLLKHNLLNADQIQECIYVKAKMAEMGLVKSLGEVIFDKDYLDSKVIKGLIVQYTRQKQFAKQRQVTSPAKEAVSHE